MLRLEINLERGLPLPGLCLHLQPHLDLCSPDSLPSSHASLLLVPPFLCSVLPQGLCIGCYLALITILSSLTQVSFYLTFKFPLELLFLRETHPGISKSDLFILHSRCLNDRRWKLMFIQMLLGLWWGYSPMNPLSVENIISKMHLIHLIYQIS